MRKIVAAEMVSLDGVVEAPNTWVGPYFNEEVGRFVGASMAASDALLLGRVTYQEFVPFWADKTGEEDPVSAHMSGPKYVVSTTLDSTSEWRNAELVTGDVVGELTRLKQQPGRNISVSGSVGLVRSLLRDRLLDELQLLVFPLVLGAGKRLFPEGVDRADLRLASSEAFGSGVLALTYVPADR